MFFSEPFGGVIPGASGAVLAALMRTGTPLTGRQVHGLLRDDFSLWTVQEALKALAHLGIVSTQTIGRAGVHSINEDHYAVAPLRTLLNPIGVLREVVRGVVGDEVKAVVVFGSVGRGEAGPESDVDIAVIAKTGWDDRVRIQDAVRARLGNSCEVLAFTSAEFSRLAAAGEPVVAAILSEGCLSSVPCPTSSTARRDGHRRAAQPRACLPDEGPGVPRLSRGQPGSRTQHPCRRRRDPRRHQRQGRNRDRADGRQPQGQGSRRCREN